MLKITPTKIMKEMKIHSDTINYIHTEFDMIYSTKKCVISGKDNNRKPPNAFIKAFLVDSFPYSLFTYACV